MTASSPGEPSEPTPDEIRRGLAQLENLVAEHAPAPEPEPAPLYDPAAGETKRVQQLRKEVAEARLLADLQGDDTPLLLDTDKVRKHRRAAHEAARLHALSQDPTMRAWRAARMRRLVITIALTALTLALGWSTAGVQTFAADGADPWTPGWVFSWFVEPFMSLALLVIVVSRTYMATLGQPITSRTLVRIEWLFLGLTVGMNAFPYLPGVAADFRFPRLVFHIIGPIVAVAIVTALPIILEAFHRLDVGLPGNPLTSPRYWANAASGAGSGNPSGNPSEIDDIEIKAARIRALIATGELPSEPGVKKIRDALGCRMSTAQIVRDRLAEGGGWRPDIDEEYR